MFEEKQNIINNKNSYITTAFLQKCYIGKILYLESVYGEKILNKMNIIITSIEKHTYSDEYYTFMGYEFVKNKMDSNQLSREILVKITETGNWECTMPSVNGEAIIKYSIF